MGVQVRITRARGLVLVGNPHQTGQPHQVLLPRHRVVHAGVAGMLREVFQGLRDRGCVRVRDGFVGHLAGPDRPGQRHTFGGAERQIEAVHTAVPQRPPARSVGYGAVIQPTPHHVGISCPTRPLNIGETHEFGCRVGVSGAHPHRGAGVVFGVVLPQPATGSTHLRTRRRSGAGGVVVIADRPPRKLGNRQHPTPPETSNRLAHNPGESTRDVCYRQSRTPMCKCAIAIDRFLNSFAA